MGSELDVSSGSLPRLTVGDLAFAAHGFSFCSVVGAQSLVGSLERPEKRFFGRSAPCLRRRRSPSRSRRRAARRRFAERTAVWRKEHSEFSFWMGFTLRALASSLEELL